MIKGAKRVLAIVAAVVAADAAGVTIHRSFRNGYPAAVSEARRGSVESAAAVGVTRVSPTTKMAAYKKTVGKVTQVGDGNTIWVTDAAGKHKVRLAKSDAPESDQPYGKEATQFLSNLILGKQVEVRWTDKDPSGCILGVIYLNVEKGMVDVNLTMVKNGCAWHYPDRAITPVYADAEKDARKFRRGLWAAESPISPRQWRKSKRRK